MATTSVTVELPEEIVAFLGSPEKMNERVRKSLVLELLREGEISQGKGAELLGLSRWEMLDFIKAHNIPSGPQSAEEMREDIEVVRRVSKQD